MAAMKLSVALSLVAVLPISTRAFVSSTSPSIFSTRGLEDTPALRRQSKSHLLKFRCSRLGPKPLLASAKPDVVDTRSIVTEMEQWIHRISYECHTRRDYQYKVSLGTSMPEVLFDFWRMISETIDEHRSTKDNHGMRKLIMMVAPFCEELKDYQTMENTNQLLEQSARDGGCADFGKEITHLHYHPNFRYRPSPKETRMSIHHAPYPAFSLNVLYGKGGLKSLQARRAEEEDAQKAKRPSPVRPKQGTPNGKRHEKNDEWAEQARSSLENVYNTPACYGAEYELEEMEWDIPWQVKVPLPGRTVPESSQEILQATKEWLKRVLEDAADCDTAAAAKQQEQQLRNVSFTKTTAAAKKLENGDSQEVAEIDTSERSTAFMPPTAAEVSAAMAAAQTGDSGVSSSSALDGTTASTDVENIQEAAQATLQGALTVASNSAASEMSDGEWELDEEWNFEDSDDVALLPGKELVKRMSNIAQYIIARSKTAEEAYSDVWEVVMDMADRAATRGCSVPTEDYSSSSSPCYSAVMVTPDLATCNADSFRRFQEIMNRGLKHLPMEHDISVEAFHPETVSEASSLDHHFMRSPYPTLHICYHGLREQGTALHPAVNRKAYGGEEDEEKSEKKRKSGSQKAVASRLRKTPGNAAKAFGRRANMAVKGTTAASSSTGKASSIGSKAQVEMRGGRKRKSEQRGVDSQKKGSAALPTVNKSEELKEKAD